MNLHFYKYQANGNDFILIDNRSGTIDLSKDQIIKACDRKFGVGADGLILLENDEGASFGVDYYNSDGSQSLCGNGSRAAVHFASFLGVVNGRASFRAFDGMHDAELLKNGLIRLQMAPVSRVERIGDDFLIDTGSPHLIRFVKGLDTLPVYEEGRAIRYSDRFKKNGVNVNFVEITAEGTLFVRTYERGVENETLSCGTGVTAAALAAFFYDISPPTAIVTRGGNLTVEFKSNDSGSSGDDAVIFDKIFLVGPAKMVFQGDLEL